jgi:VIT1/CCC1 family predicted Fe2+/Mn2+ transporter
MAPRSKQTFALYVRSFIFGVEDSLVSTVGLLSGIAVAGVERSVILLTGLVLIFVEAFSMGIGNLLSEHASQEFLRRKELPWRGSLAGGTIMFLSYFFAGFIPLFPYIFIEAQTAFWVSIGLSLAALFVLGAVGAKIFQIRLIRHGLEMMLIGGIAVSVGVLVGTLLQVF